jgi:ABC-type phosphate/phosphonate transport system substrate-binding protein
MIASLPMYDWPEVRVATDGWWKGLSGHLGIGLELERNSDHTAPWRRPDLLFSQTCGYPFTHEFAGVLRYLATPHYAVEGCEGATYCSMVFAREQVPLASFRGRVAAVNTPDSMSGMLALKLAFAKFNQNGKFFAKAIQTGSHADSLAAVRDGSADVCAIDCVAVAMARRYRPSALEGLVEIARSPQVPSLPFVTRAGDIARLRRGLAAACADQALASFRERLFISGQSVLEPNAYDLITNLENQMQNAGGLELPGT